MDFVNERGEEGVTRTPEQEAGIFFVRFSMDDMLCWVNALKELFTSIMGPKNFFNLQRRIPVKIYQQLCVGVKWFVKYD